MTYTEKERLISTISWGKLLVVVITSDKKRIQLVLRNPTPEENARAAAIYQAEYQYAILSGLPTEESAIKDMIIARQWSQETDTQIEGIKQDIHKIRRGLLDFIFNKTKLEQARSLLRSAEVALIDRLTKRQALLQNTAEAHATMCQQRYLIGRITETNDGLQMWPTQEAFDTFQDVDLVTQLCGKYFDTSRVPNNRIREIARSQPWRQIWDAGIKVGSLFSGPPSSWSVNQKELSYWSTVYDSVFEAFERPSTEIIEDDDLLDSWFIRQGEKIAVKAKTDFVNKSGSKEQFIVADKDGAQSVYAMNDPTARAKIRGRQQFIQKQGTVAEQHMPDSQLEMRQQLTEMQRRHVKDITRR